MARALNLADLKQRLGSAYRVQIRRSEIDAQQLSPAAPGTVNAADVVSSSELREEDAPLIPSLEETRFNDVQEDEEIDIRYIERNLLNSQQLISLCDRLRTEYYELSKSYVEIQLRAEEFVRLDGVHLLEVGAGIYELSKRELEPEQKGLAAAKDSFGRQHRQINDLLKNERVVIGQDTPGPIIADPSGLLGSPQKERIALDQAELTEYQAISRQAECKERALRVATYRSEVEAYSWSYTETAVQTAERQLDARLDALGPRMEWAEKDILFRSKRAAIARDTGYSQLREHLRPGSPINFSQRMDKLRESYNRTLVQLCQTVKATQAGLSTLYDIESEIPLHDEEFLTPAISEWFRDTCTALDYSNRKERTWHQSINLSELMSNSSHGLRDLKAGEIFEFSFPEGLAPNGALLRGIALEAVGDQSACYRAELVPPTGPSPLSFGRILSTMAAEPIKIEYTEVLWNRTSSGSWKIRNLQGVGQLEGLRLTLQLAQRG